mmetsp:Transcript_17485/g.35088  ORF Transcript_17485/g.35088 Transcript_17485/m.35088 type:complete len:362 (+) Transcript_17485:265-1350(+)
MFGQFPFYNFNGSGAGQGAQAPAPKQGKPPKPAVKVVVDEKYHDHLHDEMDEEECYKRKNTGGVTSPFPEKLMEMLAEVDPSIIGWLSHGRGFKIRNQKVFVDSVMQVHFKHTKITSFQRQLNLYGFRRITRGPDTGAYYHEFFLRDMPKLSLRMRRQKIKGTGHKPHHDIETEPDFYRMEPVGPMSAQQQAEFSAIAAGQKHTESGGGGNGGGGGPTTTEKRGGRKPVKSIMEEEPSSPPGLVERLSGSWGGNRVARTISTMLRRVSSLGSEGWDEQQPPVENLDEEITVDFDEIFKGDGSGDAGDDMMRTSNVGEPVNNSSKSMLTDSGGFQTSDRSMNIGALSSSGRDPAGFQLSDRA